MPYTFNGCGTRFYGNRDKGEDGSHVVTEWITFVYIPLIPLRSLRVLRAGDGTNFIVYSSQNYRTMRVPLSWPQVRNIYLFMAPIFALILFFSWSGIRAWVNDDLLRAKPQPLRVEAAPAEPPLDPTSYAKACGSVLKLQAPAFTKLNLHERMTALVKESNFTEQEKTILNADDLENNAFSGYSLGYLTWDKPVDPIRSDLSQKMTTQINTGAAKLSTDDGAIFKNYGNKDVRMIMSAFDMGRRDGRTSPCPF